MLLKNVSDNDIFQHLGINYHAYMQHNRTMNIDPDKEIL